VTAIGVIGRVELTWDSYRIEVWSNEVNSPPIMALQLYQMPGHSVLNSPGRQTTHTMIKRESTSELFLVEFIRGQLDIFAFKRFYQWVRKEVEELVKKDYSLENFIAGSPMVSSSLLARFS
jgi:hypothetical protein